MRVFSLSPFLPNELMKKLTGISICQVLQGLIKVPGVGRRVVLVVADQLLDLFRRQPSFRIGVVDDAIGHALLVDLQ